MRFSQRIGENPLEKSIQLNSIDTDLRNGLWNNILIHIFDNVSDYIPRGSDKSDMYYLGLTIWKEFYKIPVDTIPRKGFDIKSSIRKRFFSENWTEVYDFVEFLAQLNYKELNPQISTTLFIKSINQVLETEFSAYRFSKKELVPISNELEIDEIQEAIGQGRAYTSLRGANIHFSKALDKLSDRKNPDYRNSIKESISAVETVCRVLTDQLTLGKSLSSLEGKGIKINAQLKSGFEQIYAYTNSKENGIRHAIITEFKEPDFNDAKFMLVSCSSFVNYIIGKCIESGVNINK